MGRIRTSIGKAASLSLGRLYFCVLFSAVSAFSNLPQGTASAQQAPQELANADLLGLLDCATRPDQLLAVRPESYSSDGFRVRYVYPVHPGREANQLNTMHPTNWIALVLYHRDVRYAARFEVAFDGPPSKRTFILLGAANLEKQGEQWVVKDILNGGASTWPEIVNHVD